MKEKISSKKEKKQTNKHTNTQTKKKPALNNLPHDPSPIFDSRFLFKTKKQKRHAQRR